MTSAEKNSPSVELLDAGAVHALDQHLDGAVGQLQELQNGRDRADPVQIFGLGIVDIRLLLGDQQDALVGLHGQIQRDDGLLPPDEQRNHHVRVDHHIAQRQHGHAAHCRRGFIGDIDNGFVAH